MRGGPRRGRRRGAGCASRPRRRRGGSRRRRPPPPWAWMARSSTRSVAFGATTLIMAISARAALLPTVSIMCAAFRVRSRACSISIRESAIHSWITPCSASGLPNATRLLTRLHISSSARSATPIERMQWWMRPGPSRPCAMAKPLPSPQMMFSAGHADVVEGDLGVAVRRVVVAEDRTGCARSPRRACRAGPGSSTAARGAAPPGRSCP